VETTGSATPSLVCGAGQQGVFSQLTDFHRVHGRMGPISHARVRLVRWRPVAAIAAMMAALIVMAGDSIPVRRSTIVLWAWERPEDLRFSGPDVGVAVLAGSIVLSGEAVRVTGRRYPALTLKGQRIVGVVHVEIDRRQIGAAATWLFARRLTYGLTTKMSRSPIGCSSRSRSVQPLQGLRTLELEPWPVR